MIWWEQEKERRWLWQKDEDDDDDISSFHKLFTEKLLVGLVASKLLHHIIADDIKPFEKSRGKSKKEIRKQGRRESVCLRVRVLVYLQQNILMFRSY